MVRAPYYSCLLSIFLIVACSNGDNKNFGPSKDQVAQDDSGNFKSGPCGSRVVQDYHRVVSACEASKQGIRRSGCKSLGESFINKYPDVRCTILEESNTSVSDQEIMITEDKIFEIFLSALHNGRYY